MLVVAGSYARYFNYRYKASGHVFQGPYEAEPVVTDEHLLESQRYIANNPVKAGLCERPEDWRWSSYRATAGLERHPPWLRVDLVRRTWLLRRCYVIWPSSHGSRPGSPPAATAPSRSK